MVQNGDRTPNIGPLMVLALYQQVPFRKIPLNCTMMKAKRPKLDRVGIATTVCKAVEERYTVVSACNANGISAKSFYNWVNEDPTIADLYKSAKEVARRTLNDELVKKAESGLEKAINSTTLQTIKSTKFTYKVNEDGEKVLIGVEVTERELPVNPVLLMFVLQNCDPENYGRHAQRAEPTEVLHPDSEVYDLVPPSQPTP